MKKLLYFVLAATMLVACSKEGLDYNSKQEVSNPYAVTPDEAIQLLQTVIGGDATRSMSVADIQTLSKGDFTPTTRSDADDEVIYIVDIEGGGSAIMGADRRMEPIYVIFDHTKLSAEKLIGTTTRSTSEDGNPEDYILGLLNNAIQHDMQTMGQRAKPELPIIPRDELWDEKTTYKYKAPMLNTTWHQESPFNNNYPTDTVVNQKYPAGCGIIALAQILYFHKFPNSLNGITFDWNLLSWTETGYYPPESAQIEVANFVWSINTIMDNYQDINYIRNGNNELSTGTTEYQGKYLLETAGFQDVTIANYNLDAISNMLANENLPVYVQGYEAGINGKGHAWVIDGCNIYKIDTWCRHYTDSFRYIEYLFNSVDYELVHCNFGWEGVYDGDYHSGIFYTPEGQFNTQLKYISYSEN